MDRRPENQLDNRHAFAFRQVFFPEKFSDPDCPLGKHSPPAHKIARIVYHLLNTKEAYNETVFHRRDEKALKRALSAPQTSRSTLVFKSYPY